MKTSTTSELPSLHYNDVIAIIFEKHWDKVGKYLSGVTCCDPTVEGQAKRNNFWQWVCTEYRVTNGCTLWLDISPIQAPAWVNTLYALIRQEFAAWVKNDEIRLRVSW